MMEVTMTGQKENGRTETEVKITERKRKKRMTRTTDRAPLVEGHPVSSPTVEQSQSKADPRNEKPHICEDCGHGFAYRKNLLRHKRQIHLRKDVRKYECKTCKMKFRSSLEIQSHIRTHEGDVDKLIKCSECDVGFKSNIALYHHCRVVHNHNDRSHPVPVVMYDHVIIIQDDPVKYHCTVCSSTFGSKYILQNHQLCGKEKEEGFGCKTCGKVFSFKRNLVRHINHKLCSSGVKPPTSKELSQKDDLDNHVLTLSCKKSFTCDLCHAQFPRSSNLRRHVKCHSKIPGRPLLKCHKCGVKFNSKRSLTLHVLRHKAEAQSTPKRFQCRICATSFTLKHGLNQHIKLHHQPKVVVSKLDITDYAGAQASDITTTARSDQREATTTTTEGITVSSPLRNSAEDWDHNESETPVTSTKADSNGVVSKLQVQGMTPSGRKPEGHDYSTVFVVALPMPVIHLSTNKMFIIDQNFKWRTVPDMLDGDNDESK